MLSNYSFTTNVKQKNKITGKCVKMAREKEYDLKKHLGHGENTLQYLNGLNCFEVLHSIGQTMLTYIPGYFFFASYVGERPWWLFTRPQQRKKEESERLRVELDQIKFMRSHAYKTIPKSDTHIAIHSRTYTALQPTPGLMISNLD